MSQSPVTVLREEMIKAMTDRFLGWKLPHSFSPDNGIEFDKPVHVQFWPIGTNLLTADEAKAMFEHCLPPLIPAVPVQHDDCRKYCQREAEQAAALASEAKADAAPEIVFELPEGEKRRIVVLDNKIRYGDRVLSVAIEDPPATVSNTTAPSSAVVPDAAPLDRLDTIVHALINTCADLYRANQASKEQIIPIGEDAEFVNLLREYVNANMRPDDMSERHHRAFLALCAYIDASRPAVGMVSDDGAAFDTSMMRIHLEHIRHCAASDLPSARATFFGFLAGSYVVRRDVGMVAAPTVNYAQELATSIWRKHYSQESPQWKVHADLVGVLSQIDNMAAGMVRKPAAPDLSVRDAADFVDRKAEQYLKDNASTEHDTGATIWHFGDAGRDYHSSLVELAEELRALRSAAPSTDTGAE